MKCSDCKFGSTINPMDPQDCILVCATAWAMNRAFKVSKL